MRKPGDNYEWSSLPFIRRSDADIKSIIPSVDRMQEYINDLKKSIEKETDEVKKRKKIIILEEYIIYQHELKNRV